MLKIGSLLLAVNIMLSALTGCAPDDGSAISDIIEGTYHSTPAESGESSAESGGEGQGGKYALSNPDSTAETQAVYDYINEIYKTKIISGQQESTWMQGGADYEMNYISDVTGKLPAIRGLDYMHMDFDGVNKRAVEWWEKGGIVTICWHCGPDFRGEWTNCMNEVINDWDAALTEGTPEYEKLIAGMDMGGKALQELRDAGVPVLWRPFHELDGGWFWWSKGGADNFKKLWKIMYDRYTNYWGLNNLIWVYGYSHANPRSMEEWYVGDEYCDIVGADSYNKGANQSLYKAVNMLVEDRKPICFHECGTIPTSKELTDHGALWCFFMTWHTSYITDENNKDALKSIYNDDYVITLDELPSFK